MWPMSHRARDLRPLPLPRSVAEHRLVSTRPVGDPKRSPVLNVSTLLEVSETRSDALRYGLARDGQVVPRAATERRPVVVWNLTRACNLACDHCYASAHARPSPVELTPAEARSVVLDLAAFGVPALLFSGGEPLTRSDLLPLVRHAVANGLRVTLSSNGTLIDEKCARAIALAGVEYVGISIDGDRRHHDRMRRCVGAHDMARAGLQALRGAQVRRGVRLTLTQGAVSTLDAVLELVVQEQVERLCVYHLVPAGRGRRLDDLTVDERRTILERVFEFAASHPAVEVLTVDNPSDGPFLLRWIARRDEAAAERCRRALRWNRGGAAGAGVALGCIDPIGDVHPDQFSWHRVLGNVRDRPFSAIWRDPADPMVRELRRSGPRLAGPCRSCRDADLCGGGFRSRAEAVTGDPWGFDPSCTLVRG